MSGTIDVRAELLAAHERCQKEGDGEIAHEIMCDLIPEVLEQLRRADAMRPVIEAARIRAGSFTSERLEEDANDELRAALDAYDTWGH